MRTFFEIVVIQKYDSQLVKATMPNWTYNFYFICPYNQTQFKAKISFIGEYRSTQNNVN